MDSNREVVFLFRLPDRKFILVTRAKNEYFEKSVRFYLGSPRRLLESKVVRVSVYLDGGTTIIETEKGLMYFPTPYKKADSTWKPGELFEIPLVKLDPEKYDISELVDMATVTKKKKQ